MDILSKFSENISELLIEENITIEEFAKAVNINLSEVYRYKRKEYLPHLSNIIKIADCYNYSIDFLLGFIQFPANAIFKKTPPFSQTFKNLLNDKDMTRYKLSKKLEISLNRIDDWYHGKSIPSLDNAIKLKNYFKCSLDELLGRIN